MSDMEQSKTYEVQSSVKKKKKSGGGGVSITCMSRDYELKNSQEALMYASSRAGKLGD